MSRSASSFLTADEALELARLDAYIQERMRHERLWWRNIALLGGRVPEEADGPREADWTPELERLLQSALPLAERDRLNLVAIWPVVPDETRDSVLRTWW